jgi:DNA-binding response OmpR family regulator
VESERPDEILKFGDLLVNLTNQQVLRAGSQIKLSSMEYRLLVQLLQHLGSFQKPTELLASVWGEEQQGSLMLLEVYAESLIRKIDAGRPTQLIQKMDDGSLRVLIGE